MTGSRASHHFLILLTVRYRKGAKAVRLAGILLKPHKVIPSTSVDFHRKRCD
jgi:hypothetical protein